MYKSALNEEKEVDNTSIFSILSVITFHYVTDQNSYKTDLVVKDRFRFWFQKLRAEIRTLTGT